MIANEFMCTEITKCGDVTAKVDQTERLIALRERLSIYSIKTCKRGPWKCLRACPNQFKTVKMAITPMTADA